VLTLLPGLGEPQARQGAEASSSDRGRRLANLGGNLSTFFTGHTQATCMTLLAKKCSYAYFELKAVHSLVGALSQNGKKVLDPNDTRNVRGRS